MSNVAPEGGGGEGVENVPFLSELCAVLCMNLLTSGLREGVTDSGLRALASAGCGAKLESLTLYGDVMLAAMPF